MIANDDKIVQSIVYIKTYAFGTCKKVIQENEETKKLSIIVQTIDFIET